MKIARKFSDTDSACTEILQALEQENWQDYFLTDRHGSRIGIFMPKNLVRDFNDIAPIGGFFDEAQAEKLLHGLLCQYAMEIAQWLIHGNLPPLIIRHTYTDEPAGYSFDKNLSEQTEYKVKLSLRRELLINGHNHPVSRFGFFVSSFCPVPRF